MPRSAERLTVECSKCGQVFETWALGTPDLDCDPELGDPGWISAAELLRAGIRPLEGDAVHVDLAN